MALGLAATIATAGLVVLFAGYLADAEWGWDDWGAVVISVWLGILFFILAWYVERDADQRAEAVANAELITSMGFLEMSAARSFAGHDHQALRIAADARAALQHYPSADERRQEALIETVENSYSDLAFGTFARADALPRSVWNQLCEGDQAVQREADVLAAGLGRHASGQQRERLADMAAHVRFVQRIGAAVRDKSGHQVGGGGGCPTHDLDEIWIEPPPKPKEGAREEAPKRLEPIEQIERLERLYSRELTVVKEWAVLRRAADPQELPDGTKPPATVSCSATLLEDLSQVREWYAPWYVKWDPADRSFKPVNVHRDPLTEAAAMDTLVPDRLLPLYPQPLAHGSVPEGMRTTAIANLCHLLHRQTPTTVCVLVHELATQQKHRHVVLDGNHRLAAALSIHDEALAAARARGEQDEFTSPVRVLAFVISEKEPIDDEAWQKVDFDTPGGRVTKLWKWNGFTPDVGLIRGTWLPPALRANQDWRNERPGLRDHVRWAVRRWTRRLLTVGRRRGS